MLPSLLSTVQVQAPLPLPHPSPLVAHTPTAALTSSPPLPSTPLAPLHYPLDEPVGVFDAWHRVGHVLHGCRDGDDLLNGIAQALPVVVPVQDVAHIRNLGRIRGTWGWLLGFGGRREGEGDSTSHSSSQEVCVHVCVTCAHVKHTMAGGTSLMSHPPQRYSLHTATAPLLVTLTAAQVAAPLPEPCACHWWFCAEDGAGYCALTGGLVLWSPRDDVRAVEALVLDALITWRD